MYACFERSVIVTPGDPIWNQGDNVSPVHVVRGFAAYRRGDATIALAAPGSFLFPYPGERRAGPAKTTVKTITEVEYQPVEDLDTIPDASLLTAIDAFIDGADRLGNMSLSQRLAALLIDITTVQGSPIINCTQDVLAMAATGRRETIALMLSQWRDYDWIQTRYRRVKVVRADMLLELIRTGIQPKGTSSF